MTGPTVINEVEMNEKEPPELVAHIAGMLMAGGHFTAVPYAVKTAREIVAAAYSKKI